VARSAAAFAALATDSVAETAEASNENEKTSKSYVDIAPSWVISVHVVGLVCESAKASSVNTEE
jgi:hypothetical protein